MLPLILLHQFGWVAFGQHDGFSEDIDLGNEQGGLGQVSNEQLLARNQHQCQQGRATFEWFFADPRDMSTQQRFVVAECCLNV